MARWKPVDRSDEDASLVDQPESAGEESLQGGGSDTRACPYCAEVIKRAAVKCRYCQSNLPPIRKVPPRRQATSHGTDIDTAIASFNADTRAARLDGGELDGLGASNFIARTIRRMGPLLESGEVTLGIGTAYFDTSLGTLWLTKRRLLHVNEEFIRLNPSTVWPANDFQHAEYKPGILYGRLTIYRRGDRDLVFKRALGCGEIVDAINRRALGQA